MILKKIILLSFGVLLTSAAFAITDPAAKEETTPLAPEGALTPDQIPPITQVGKQLAPPTTTPVPANGPKTADASPYSADVMELFAQ